LAPSKVGYIKFKDPKSCDVALHLTNTVFLDRALVVVDTSGGINQIIAVTVVLYHHYVNRGYSIGGVSFGCNCDI